MNQSPRIMDWSPAGFWNIFVIDPDWTKSSNVFETNSEFKIADLLFLNILGSGVYINGSL